MNRIGKIDWRIVAGVAGSAIAAYSLRRIVKSLRPAIIEAEHVVTIKSPAPELYRLWTDWGRVPTWMHGVRSVEKLGHGITRWVVDAPGGGTLTYDAQVLEKNEGKSFAWMTTADAPIKAYGEVHFDATKRGTAVRVVLAYNAPVGLLGVAVAGLAGVEPTSRLAEHLRRFKQLAEAGEVATNESPSARRKRKAEPGSTVKKALDVKAAVKASGKEVTGKQVTQRASRRPAERSLP